MRFLQRQIPRRATATMSRTGNAPKWLSSRLQDVKVLDGSWYLPMMGRDALAEFKDGRIPSASFFDVDGIADVKNPLPHMLPSEGSFSAAMDALEITKETPVVVYDGKGIFSAPRVWWTFKVFGHERVAVLDGGFPAWKAGGLPIDSSPISDSDIEGPAVAASSATNNDLIYEASLDKSQVRSFDEMIQIVQSGDPQRDLVVDARPPGRFDGTQPEPRAELRRGRMPGSVNVPFASLISEDGSMKSAEELKAVLVNAGVDLDKQLVLSCGSGLTACVVALASHLIGSDENNAGSVNVPFASLISEDGSMKSAEELKAVLVNAGVDLDKQLVLSCGSGLTACVVALASHLIGSDETAVETAVYDGSWSEWGSREDTPIECST